MREGLALCAHLAELEPGPAPFTLAPDEILDWRDGPVEAVVRCRSCGACAWLELLDRDPRRPLGVFALAALRAADVELYLRDRARGSCDVGRARAELEAFAASAGPFERLLALEPAELGVVAVAALAPGAAVPAGAWPERMPRPADDAWFARLGLVKGGA